MRLKPCQSLVRPAGVQASVYVSQPGAPVRTCGRSYGGHADGRTSLFRDDEALLDLWTVIKPGHVRDKIAIFAADVAGGLDPFSDRVSAPRATKAKGRWEQAINAKRRRRSGLQDPQRPAWGRGLAETAEDKVSVGKMVAFLERQVSQQQTGTKVLLAVQKNECRDRSEVKGEEPASVSVSNMVARLESECLRRRSTGDLSRSSSLRRSVGRVLLAVVDQAATPPDPRRICQYRGGGAASRSALPASAGPPRLSCSQSERSGGGGGAGLLLLRRRRVSASQDFLDKRQRLQRLLEPQPFLSVLPLHLLVQIFQLLPTQSLAALQCTCHYFKFVIQTYGVRPADSLWVSDPRYRDDPCKQCKKRYGRGDVSLCRWHHKPYCQALPYGPGYWMCCHEVRREAPGCNVGLHDNRWVPAFHSISAPIYRRLARP
ncbi:LOW QUALITY PROTEIN: F-box only protein 34 [Synchiropus picturatus]